MKPILCIQHVSTNLSFLFIIFIFGFVSLMEKEDEKLDNRVIV